jgi:hypothetical protein
MDGAKTEADSVQIGSPSNELYFSSVDLANVLQLSDSGVAKLARSAVLVRVDDPNDSHSFLYPLIENTRRYITHLQGKKETAGLLWLQEKSRTQRVMRKKAQLGGADCQGAENSLT